MAVASRLVIRNMSLLAFMRKALQKTGRMGYALPGNWPGEMFVARWRWSNAMKRRWVLFTVSDAVASKGVVATFPEDSHKKKWNILGCCCGRHITMRQ